MGKTFVIAEIGLNHNGDLGITRKLIEIAGKAGCNAVKFQKRTVDLVYTDAELKKPRKSPFGNTYGDSKRALEFSLKDYKKIDGYCRKSGVSWFASCWDAASVDFIDRFNPPFFKIASCFLGNRGLLSYTAAKKAPLILSTGMSTDSQVREAIDSAGREKIANLMHCVSSYPCLPGELNLRRITSLKEKFRLETGYSGHCPRIIFFLAAVALGARMIEFHITLDRKMWGSDQSSSLEPGEVFSLLKGIREMEEAL